MTGGPMVYVRDVRDDEGRPITCQVVLGSDTWGRFSTLCSRRLDDGACPEHGVVDANRAGAPLIP